MADLRPQKYDRELQKNLFPSNEFYSRSRVDGGIAPNVETVNIPESGAAPDVNIGVPSSFPLSISQRTDSSKSYSVRQLYTEPILITDEEEILTDYQKLQDISQDHAAAINKQAANIAAYEWGNTGGGSRIILTTGTGSRATELVGATGSVKKITKADIFNVKKQLMKDNLPNLDGLSALITPAQYNDLLEIEDFEKLGV